MVIVGCGAAATLLLAALSESIQIPLDIYLIDDNPSIPVGLAYAINHPSFILNVAAKRMGAYADRLDDFYLWLNNNPEKWRSLHSEFTNINFGPDDFVPRMIYAEYLRHVFALSIVKLHESKVRVNQIAERVINVCALSGTSTDTTIVDAPHSPALISLSNSEAMIADILVFATGNYSAQTNVRNDSHVFYSPYTSEFLQQDWATLNSVAIVGSGLSMVDVVHFVIGQGFNGAFHILSRHGLVPLAHKRDHSVHKDIKPLEITSSESDSALKILRRIRQYARKNQALGIPWQDSINQMREQINNLWANTPKHVQKRLVRLLPWWNIHRHRIPDWSHKVLDGLRSNNRLRIFKCHVETIESIDDGFRFTVKSSLTKGETVTMPVDKLIICSGYAPGFKQVQKIGRSLIPPVEELLKSFVRDNGFFKVSASHNIYALGPALSGLLFETTAIQETRQQANKIAIAVLDFL